MLKKSVIGAAVLAGFCLAVLPVSGADDKAKEKKDGQKKHAANHSAQKKDSPTGAGIIVVKDPVTGQLRAPTAEEAAALRSTQRTTRLAVQAPKEFAAPRGGVGLKLDDSTAMFAVASRGEDGKVNVGEVTGAGTADKAVKESQTKTSVKKVDTTNEK